MGGDGGGACGWELERVKINGNMSKLSNDLSSSDMFRITFFINNVKFTSKVVDNVDTVRVESAGVSVGPGLYMDGAGEA